MKGWQIAFLMILLLACAEKQRPAFDLPLNAPLMIASAEGKIWMISEKYQDGSRMNMSHCDSLYTISFKLDGSVEADYPDSQQCESGHRGQWRILKEKDGYPYLQIAKYQHQDTVVVKLLIEDLSSDRLEWQYSEREPTGVRTTIREVLVLQKLN
ncbi:MAG: lipocalin family protein [Bacteroidota bacterium]